MAISRINKDFFKQMERLLRVFPKSNIKTLDDKVELFFEYQRQCEYENSDKSFILKWSLDIVEEAISEMIKHETHFPVFYIFQNYCKNINRRYNTISTENPVIRFTEEEKKRHEKFGKMIEKLAADKNISYIEASILVINNICRGKKY